MKVDPHSRNLRLHRRMTEPGTFFVTKCLSPKKPVLIATGIADEILSTLAFSTEKERIALAAFVIMPDHWHAQFCVMPPLTLPRVMQLMDSWIGKQGKIRLMASEIAWQESYFETAIRTSRQFRYVSHYIEENPVRKGFVRTPADWKWSSANPQYQHLLARPWPYVFANEE